jgi:Flagellar hook-length control protein FliK
MAILVSNPSTSALVGLSAEAVDPSLSAPEAGFTEELAVAMRPPSQLSGQTPDGLSADDDEADEAVLNLQILPPDVLLNAVGDANFALPHPAGQPMVTEDVPTDSSDRVIGDAAQAAEMAAAALAAQMPAAQPILLAVSPAGTAVSALEQVGSGPAVAAATPQWIQADAPVNVEAPTNSAFQSAPTSTVLPQEGFAGQAAAAQAFVEQHPFASVEVSAPVASVQAHDSIAVSAQAFTQAPADQTLVHGHPALNATATKDLPNQVSSAVQATELEVNVQVLASAAGSPKPADVPVTRIAAATTTTAESANFVQPLSPTALASAETGPATAVLATAKPNGSAQGPVLQGTPVTVAPSPIESAMPMTGAEASTQLPSLGADRAPGMVSATTVNASASPLSDEPVSPDIAAVTETAFKFDAKLGGIDQKSAAVSSVPSAQPTPATPVVIAASMVRPSHEVGSDQTPEVHASASGDISSRSLAAQSTPELEASREKSTSNPKSLDELSSTFVSSLVGGAPRPVTTVMDWVSLQPQERPAAVEPHEVRLDAGAVQVEIQRMVKQGGGQVVMELTPPDQSKFTIELRLDERGSAHLVVEGVSDSTRTRLEQSAPQLHEQFQQMGLNLQLDMRQNRDSASSNAQERAPNETPMATPNVELTGQASRAATASRMREAGGSQVHLYA